METDSDIEKFKIYLKTLCLESLIEVKEEAEVFIPNYKLRIELIDIEIEIRKEQINKLKKKLQRSKCELALLRANVYYQFNEN